MCKFNPKNDSRRLDPCLVLYINFLNYALGLITRASCCGHGKYPKTTIIETISSSGKVTNLELFSGKIIPRKKRFYKKDKQGYYYIPEVVEKFLYDSIKRAEDNLTKNNARTKAHTRGRTNKN